ncbi:MAG: hypothetical protein JO057_15840, partial [Chloroflexi bacterium]|nr:hypothetical protein [Chloroflexota bacterium]
MRTGERLVVEKALVVNHELHAQGSAGRAIRGITAEPERRDVEVVTVTSVDDAGAVVISDPSLQAIIVDWSLGLAT